MAGAGAPIIKGMTDGETVHKFIDRKIRPDTKYLERCSETIDKLIRFLEMKGGSQVTVIDDKKISVKRILKSGSLGKGTAVREMSDVDLIIFFNGFSSIRELNNDMQTMLKTIKSYIETDTEWSKRLTFKEMTPLSVQFCLKNDDDDQTHEVGLLPAVDITQLVSKDKIYEQMKDEESLRPVYSASLSPYQRQFVISVPAKVKDLIRLLKYWAKADDVPLRACLLELLVISHWREDHKPLNFDINLYFKHLIQKLSQLKTLAIAFDDNYNFRLFRSNLKCPYCLDPANPYRNVAPSVGDVYTVTQKATEVLKRLG